MSQARSDPGRGFSIPTALLLTAAGVAAMIEGGQRLARSGLSLRAQIAAGTLLLALPAAIALAARPAAWPSVRGPRVGLDSRTAGLSVLLGAALWVASAGLMEVQSLVALPPPAYLDAFRAIHRALAPTGPLDALVSVLVIAVLPGVCEELVVRGVLLPALAARTGGAALDATDGVGRRIWPAILGSALLFAAIHLDPYRFLFTLTLGAVFGWLRLATGSLWPPVVAHASLNTLTFLVAPFVDDPNQPYTPSPALGALCLVTGTAVAWPLLRRFAGGRRAERP